jgi:hypothetical protein
MTRGGGGARCAATFAARGLTKPGRNFFFLAPFPDDRRRPCEPAIIGRCSRCRQENAMKRTILAIGLCVAASCAWAQDEVFAPIVVERGNADRLVVDCSPPNGDEDCAYYHELIRRNFTPEEINMLFGSATASLQYRTGYDRARRHYAWFLDEIAYNGLPVVPVDLDTAYLDQ